MRKQVLAAVMVLALGWTGCEQKPIATYSTSAGSVALSRDDALLYAVDTDNGIVAVVDTEAYEKVAEIKVGRAPERITVGPDDTLYVSNRGDRSVSVIRRGEWTEAARLKVGVEPMGLAVSADGQTLFVVNTAMLDTTETGSVAAFDTATLAKRWELPVGEEPRGIALREDGTALVTLHRSGEVVQLDLSSRDRPKVLKASTGLYERANATLLLRRGPGGSAQEFPGTLFHARGMTDVVVSPDGRRAFATAQWAREDPVVTPGMPDSGGGGGSLYGGGGPCGTGAIASPGIVTFEADTAEPLVDDHSQTCHEDGNPDYPPNTITSPDPSHPVQGPIASVVDATGAWLYVVNRETNNVAVIPTDRRSGEDLSRRPGVTTSTVRQLVRVGSGPTGIALSRDGRRAYVYNGFDHTLSRLVGDGTGTVNIREEEPRLKLAGDVLPPEVVMGRKLFFSALDTRMTASNVGAACSTCHHDVRDDGHTWMFPDGPRQTPTIAGRMIPQTGPFHWSGEFSSLSDFLDTTVRHRMGGGMVDAFMTAQLTAFMDAAPAPDNPYQREQMTEAQIRGSQVFLKARCDECHAGQALTNNNQANVGTFVLTGAQPDIEAVRKLGLNTPSLLGLARSAPYLHDGSAKTLRERIFQTRYTDQHGKTSQLSDAEVEDLVEFLRTL
ncbi:c-type cytochrome [Stigmatella hybrida]|uniref:c-type cytochrome n=1 Tax=Stigmatella hybrida TaxID=394097 RepID=UPI001CDAF036|nr:c-type cytochrome [Stigmatella hybrida]